MRDESRFEKNKQSIKDMLLAAILLESSKPYQEMDSSLITECVDFLMELEGVKRLEDCKIREMIAAIPFKDNIVDFPSTPKRKIGRRGLAALVAVLAVMAMFIASFMYATGIKPVDVFDKVGEILSGMFGGAPYEVDGETFIKISEVKTYDTAEELAEAENIRILYPTWLPDNEKIVSADYMYFGNFEGNEKKNIMLHCSNIDYSISIHLGESIHEEQKETCRMRKINGLECYYLYTDNTKFDDLENVYQANFEYNGMLYSVGANTEEDLFKIIEGLKEIG